jgi:hypothetical protein
MDFPDFQECSSVRKHMFADSGFEVTELAESGFEVTALSFVAMVECQSLS